MASVGCIAQIVHLSTAAPAPLHTMSASFLMRGLHHQSDVVLLAYTSQSCRGKTHLSPNKALITVDFPELNSPTTTSRNSSSSCFRASSSSEISSSWGVASRRWSSTLSNQGLSWSGACERHGVLPLSQALLSRYVPAALRQTAVQCRTGLQPVLHQLRAGRCSSDDIVWVAPLGNPMQAAARCALGAGCRRWMTVRRSSQPCTKMLP